MGVAFSLLGLERLHVPSDKRDDGFDPVLHLAVTEVLK